MMECTSMTRCRHERAGHVVSTVSDMLSQLLKYAWTLSLSLCVDCINHR